MKEIIDGLNLPKQILDKTDRFMTKLFGPSIKEIGELFADKIRYRRLKNQINIFKKTISLLEENGLEPNELKLRTLVPLIEKSSLEEDESLQDRWANLIANISSSPETGLEPKLINTLSNLSSLEANILDFIQNEYYRKRKKIYNNSLNNKWRNWKSEEDVPMDYFSINFSSIKDKFNLTDEFARIYIDNLESLGLIKYEQPEIEIDNGSTDAELTDDEYFGQRVKLDLDIGANVYQSNDFNLTPYGNYFMRQCKMN